MLYKPQNNTPCADCDLILNSGINETEDVIITPYQNKHLQIWGKNITSIIKVFIENLKIDVK